MNASVNRTSEEAASGEETLTRNDSYCRASSRIPTTEKVKCSAGSHHTGDADHCKSAEGVTVVISDYDVPKPSSDTVLWGQEENNFRRSLPVLAEQPGHVDHYDLPKSPSLKSELSSNSNYQSPQTSATDIYDSPRSSSRLSDTSLDPGQDCQQHIYNQPRLSYPPSHLLTADQTYAECYDIPKHHNTTKENEDSVSLSESDRNNQIVIVSRGDEQKNYNQTGPAGEIEQHYNIPRSRMKTSDGNLSEQLVGEDHYDVPKEDKTGLNSDRSSQTSLPLEAHYQSPRSSGSHLETHHQSPRSSNSHKVKAEVYNIPKPLALKSSCHLEHKPLQDKVLRQRLLNVAMDLGSTSENKQEKDEKQDDEVKEALISNVQNEAFDGDFSNDSEINKQSDQSKSNNASTPSKLLTKPEHISSAKPKEKIQCDARMSTATEASETKGKMAHPTEKSHDYLAKKEIKLLTEPEQIKSNFSSHSELHYTIQSKDGDACLYAKTSVKRKKPPDLNKDAGSAPAAHVQPPELPPRNTPQSSPRNSGILASNDYQEVPVPKHGIGMLNMESMSCARCDDNFEAKAKIVNSNGELFHPQCFVCAQCFRPFPDGVFYEFEGRKYCEHDFHVLFAPCCGKCGEFIIGRVIKAMSATWHPQCFTCEMCHKELADQGFVKNQGRALCHDCNAKVKAEGVGKYMCQKCHSVIDGEPLRFRGEVYHPYHFNCTACGNELTSSAREVRTRPGYTANELNELYCLRCHDKMGIPICGACRRPIEERVVTALGKHWHVEHFVCAKCEKPFLGNRHYERKGLAYCETHYHQLFGNLCYVCNQVIQGDVFTALNKAWCVNHFACSSCDQKMTVKTKFFEVDLKPVCKKCYEKYPRELRLRLKKYHENEAARDQGVVGK